MGAEALILNGNEGILKVDRDLVIFNINAVLRSVKTLVFKFYGFADAVRTVGKFIPVHARRSRGVEVELVF